MGEPDRLMRPIRALGSTLRVTHTYPRVTLPVRGRGACGSILGLRRRVRVTLPTPGRLGKACLRPALVHADSNSNASSHARGFYYPTIEISEFRLVHARADQYPTIDFFEFSNFRISSRARILLPNDRISGGRVSSRASSAIPNDPNFRIPADIDVYGVYHEVSLLPRGMRQ